MALGVVGGGVGYVFMLGNAIGIGWMCEVWGKGDEIYRRVARRSGGRRLN